MLKGRREELKVLKSERILLFESSGLNEFVGKSWLQGSAENNKIIIMRVVY